MAAQGARVAGGAGTTANSGALSLAGDRTIENRGLSPVTPPKPGSVPGYSGRRLFRPELGFGLDALLALFLADLAVLEVAAFDGALRRLVPLRQPVAERVAVPRRLRPQLRQAELFPQLPRALHVFALGERKRRHVALHRGVHQQRRVLFSPVLALG